MSSHSYLGRTHGAIGLSYLDDVSRAWPFLSKYGLDLLIVAAAVVSAIGTALRDDPAGRTACCCGSKRRRSPRWSSRCSGDAGSPSPPPTAMWLSTAALSFLDGSADRRPGRALPRRDGRGAPARQPAPRRPGTGRPGDRARRVRDRRLQRPGHTAGDLVFTPMLFATCWLVGFALRERAEQTEAAEERAARAEREREAAARVAVAEERGRIARELHDVVAHAVSVMVLQVGAVRHRMPETDTEGTGRPSRTSNRQAAPHSRRCAVSSTRCEPDGDELELAAASGARRPRCAGGRRAGGGAGRPAAGPR